MSRYYDRRGEPIGIMDWAARLKDPEVKGVAQTQVGDLLVSTVWLGLDHNLVGGLPLIFETMVFDGDHNPASEGQSRYSTEAQAVQGHDTLVAMLKAKALP